MASAQRRLRSIEMGPRSFDLAGLVQAMVAGEEAAFARFQAATSGLLFGLLLLILGDTATAEKVLLAVYAEVRQHAARFEKTEESLLTWLITIAHRRALEHLCTRGGDQEFAMSVGLAVTQDSGAGRGFRISKSAHRRLIGVTLNSLSPVERKMIELAYFSQLPTQAIAARLRQTPDEVNVGLKYGVSQLYNLFKNQELVSDVQAAHRSERKMRTNS